MLVNCEEYLGNLRFRVNLQLLLNVSRFAIQNHAPGSDVADNVRFGVYNKVEAKGNLVAHLLLLFQLGVYIKK